MCCTSLKHLHCITGQNPCKLYIKTSLCLNIVYLEFHSYFLFFYFFWSKFQFNFLDLWDVYVFLKFMNWFLKTFLVGHQLYWKNHLDAIWCIHVHTMFIPNHSSCPYIRVILKKQSFDILTGHPLILFSLVMKHFMQNFRI